MILDRLENASLYYRCHPLFERAFVFLRAAGTGEQLSAKTDIGAGMTVLMMSKEGKGKGGAALEAHQRFIDIQYTTGGTDVIGWRPLTGADAGRGYDQAKDIEFFDQAPQSWFDVPAGSFAIFYPGDGHAPMSTPEHITKLVVKVPVES